MRQNKGLTGKGGTTSSGTLFGKSEALASGKSAQGPTVNRHPKIGTQTAKIGPQRIALQSANLELISIHDSIPTITEKKLKPVSAEIDTFLTSPSANKATWRVQSTADKLINLQKMIDLPSKTPKFKSVQKIIAAVESAVERTRKSAFFAIFEALNLKMLQPLNLLSQTIENHKAKVHKKLFRKLDFFRLTNCENCKLDVNLKDFEAIGGEIQPPREEPSRQENTWLSHLTIPRPPPEDLSIFASLEQKVIDAIEKEIAKVTHVGTLS